MYFYLPDKIIATAPRCASRSHREALGSVQEYSKGAKNLYFDDRPVIAFIRDPIDRFKSCFRLFVSTGDILINWPGFVDAVLDTQYEDAHFIPQAQYHQNNGKSVVTDIYPFERIDELWGSVVGVGHFPWLGKTSSPNTNDYRIDELKEYFKDDYELRAQL